MAWDAPLICANHGLMVTLLSPNSSVTWWVLFCSVQTMSWQTLSCSIHVCTGTKYGLKVGCSAGTTWCMASPHLSELWMRLVAVLPWRSSSMLCALHQPIADTNSPLWPDLAQCVMWSAHQKQMTMLCQTLCVVVVPSYNVYRFQHLQCSLREGLSILAVMHNLATAVRHLLLQNCLLLQNKHSAYTLSWALPCKLVLKHVWLLATNKLARLHVQVAGADCLPDPVGMSEGRASLMP